MDSELKPYSQGYSIGEVMHFDYLDYDPDCVEYVRGITDAIPDEQIDNFVKICKSFIREHDKKNGKAKFLKISDDLELNRYRGADFVKLIGSRPAKSGCQPKCYEIIVSKDKIQNNAVCYIDDEITFEIVNHGMSSCDVEAMAVSALHRLVKRRKQANERRNRSRKRNQIEKLALKGVSE